MYSSLICPATEQYPRNSEGDIAVLPDGRLLLAYTRFERGKEDDAPASIAGMYSSDAGRTWSQPTVLHANDARQNCMSASLLLLPTTGELLLCFLRKNSSTDLQVCLKRSPDLGRTWGEVTRVSDGTGYYVMNNARLLRLSTGRLVAPVARCDDADGPETGTGHFRSGCYLSDDEGRTWRAPTSWVDLARRGAMEPAVVERKDGSLLMILRTQFGHIYRAESSDGGETWANVGPTPLLSPDSPASIARIPSSGDLLVVWNDNYDRGLPMGGRRTPLRSAISTDDGNMWLRYRTLERDIHRDYAYTSISFAGDETLFTYYERDCSGRISLRFRALPTSWFYELEDIGLRQYVYAGSGQHA